MPAHSKGVRATTHVLALRETFQIARGAADEETVVVAELEHDGIVARGEGAPVDYWGETPEGIDRRARGRRRRAARRRPVRGRGDPRAASRPGTGRRARRWRSTARSTTGSASASASRSGGCSAPTGVTPPTSYTIGIDTRRGDRGPDAPRDRLRGAQDQGRRAGRPRAPARGARGDRARGCGSTATRAGTSTRPATLTPELIELGVEFVEQPFPAARPRRLPRLPRAARRGCRC